MLDHTQVGAAIFNVDDEVLLRDDAFNVIQSKSVLHHVRDYKAALRLFFAKLSSPA